MEIKRKGLNDTDPDREIEHLASVNRRKGVKKKCLPTVLLRRVVLGSAVTCAVVNCMALAVTVAIGHWPFGAILCQLYGWLSQILISSCAWMMALYTLERCCFYTMPTDYPYLMSDLNTKLLMYGTVLLLVVLHTSPLYGWGEYSQFTGALHVSLVAFNGSFEEIVSSNPVPIVQSLTTSSLIETTNSNAVNAPTEMPQAQWIHIYIQAIKIVTNDYDCEVRTNPINMLQFGLRCQSEVSFDSLLTSYANGDLSFKVDNEVKRLVEDVRGKVPMNIRIDNKNVLIYQTTFLAIQDVGMCTLDWSSVNQNVTSWMAIVILTSTCMPYLITISGSLLLLRYSIVFESPDPHVRTQLCHFLCGAIFGIASTVPYYVFGINIWNSIAIKRVYYIFGIVLYYTNSLWFSIFIVCPMILRTNT